MTTVSFSTSPVGPPPALSARQVVARTRRVIDRLATDRLATSAIPDHVAGACDATIAAEHSQPYQRSGRTQTMGLVYEYVWSFWPTTAEPLSRDVRALAAALGRTRTRSSTSAVPDEPWAAPERQAEQASIGDQQQIFSPRDPRLAWQLPDGSVVLDEIATNLHPTGLWDSHMHRRLWADVAIGAELARRLGTSFAGVRLLPLRRPPSEALLITASQTCWQVLLFETLDCTALSPTRSDMAAGVWA